MSRLRRLERLEDLALELRFGGEIKAMAARGDLSYEEALREAKQVTRRTNQLMDRGMEPIETVRTVATENGSDPDVAEQIYRELIAKAEGNRTGNETADRFD